MTARAQHHDLVGRFVTILRDEGAPHPEHVAERLREATERAGYRRMPDEIVADDNPLVPIPADQRVRAIDTTAPGAAAYAEARAAITRQEPNR